MAVNDKINTTKKLNAENSIFDFYKYKNDQIREKKSRFYYFCILLANLCTLILAMLWLKNTSNVESFSIIWQEFNFQFVLLMLFILIIILILQTLPNYLKIYNCTGSRRFGTLFKSNINKLYFNRITLKSLGGNYTSTLYLTDKKIKNCNSIELTMSNDIIDKFSRVVYSFIFLVLGLLLWIENISIWLYLAALLPFVFNFFYVMIVLMFIKNKKSVLNFISNVIKFFYNRNLISDYEKCYNNIINKLIVYEKSLKLPKVLVFVEIFANFLILFLKGVMLYFAITSLNMANENILGEVLFGFVILELLITISPLPKGTIIYEILFVLLFDKLFYNGYLFWGMVLYRVLDYFIYAMLYLIVYFVDKIIAYYNTMQTE